MDPNANLKELIDLARFMQSEIGSEDGDTEILADNAPRLIELVLALHDWLSHGGFLPAQWQNHRTNPNA